MLLAEKSMFFLAKTDPAKMSRNRVHDMSVAEWAEWYEYPCQLPYCTDKYQTNKSHVTIYLTKY